MELSEFKSRLKSDNACGWYIFAGEEDYLKKHYLGLLRKQIVSDDTFALFNHTVFEGDDIDFSSVAEAIKSPPMMSEYKLIEWRFADIDSLREGEKAAIEELFSLKEEYPNVCFAILTTSAGFDTGTAKRPSKNAARLMHGFDIITFNKSTEQQLIAWLKKHFDAEGVFAPLEALNALIFRSGRSMEILNNEVAKLCCYAKANGKSGIDARDVYEIASSSSESDAFALSNAVIEKNISKAFSAMADLKMRRVEPNAIIAMLSRTYSELVSVSLLLDEGLGASDIESTLKFHPFKAKLYIGAAKKSRTQKLVASLDKLRRIDASSKSGGLTGYGVVEMFITQNIQ